MIIFGAKVCCKWTVSKWGESPVEWGRHILGLSDMSMLYSGYLLLTSDLPGIYEDIKRDAQYWRHQLARWCSATSSEGGWFFCNELPGDSLFPGDDRLFGWFFFETSKHFPEIHWKRCLKRRLIPSYEQALRLHHGAIAWVKCSSICWLVSASKLSLLNAR